MKINKLNEDFQNDLANKFFFITNKESIKFLESLNLTNEQYSKLEEIISEYAYERYQDGNQDGLDEWAGTDASY